MKPVTQKVQKTLTRLDNMNRSKAEFIAESMGMTAKALGLKLRAEGSLFSDLLLAERKRRFFNALIDNRATTGRVMAEICGSADTAGLYATVKRWTGLTYGEVAKLAVPELRTVLWFRPDD